MKQDTPLEASLKIGEISLVTLAKSDNYQKQICVVPPSTVIPLHRHKNVRTHIVFLYGFAIFTRGSERIELTTHAHSGRGFIVEPGEEHGAETKEQHCVFISEQYWLENEPVKSLHLNWEGKPINKDHERQLVEARGN